MEPNVLVVLAATIVFGLVTAIAAGGTIAVILRRVAADKNAVDAMEKLYLSFPPETKEIISRLADTVDAAVELIKKVSDGLPNDPPAVG